MLLVPLSLAEAVVSQTHSTCDDEAQQILPRPVRRFDGI